MGGALGGSGGGGGGAGTCFAHVTAPRQSPLPVHIVIFGHVLPAGSLYSYVYE